jgi:hypothetical protein
MEEAEMWKRRGSCFSRMEDAREEGGGGGREEEEGRTPNIARCISS